MEERGKTLKMQVDKITDCWRDCNKKRRVFEFAREPLPTPTEWVDFGV